MAAIGIIDILLPIFVVSILQSDTPFYPKQRQGSTKYYKLAVYVVLGGLAASWARLVTRLVPDPYLDEVFHIPQAQAYFDRRYDVWDPKLTTPPGLYAFAVLFARILPFPCDPIILRTINAGVLWGSIFYTSECRGLITWSWKQNPAKAVAQWQREHKPISSDMLHTALNIALFPPLFFFSGLFYTDVLSTCVVLRTYRLYLEREGAYKHSANGLLWLFPTGIIALTMRQTNIFWVAVFLGALEAIRTIKSDAADVDVKGDVPGTWQQTVAAKFKQYSRGKIHDPIIRDAGLEDFILCAISIAVAALFRPLLLVVRLWPYILLIISFVCFLFWNGGVVLGDKTNHVATIHLSQMLYIWPLITFFSIPLILPVVVAHLRSLVTLLRTPLFPRLLFKYVFVALVTGGALVATLVIIKFNTIIHPFTLADNRHYMFYVFRYTILRHPAVRYLLAPVYLACAWCVYLTLCGSSSPRAAPVTLKDKKLASGPDSPKSAPVDERRADTETGGPRVSFIIVLLVSTALSLVGAPLVEPRYFILPWVIWRLNVPALPRSIAPSPPSRKTTKQSIRKSVGYTSPQAHDYRLWLETAWFLLINAVTGYIFLYRGFSWPQEPGKVQRFMW